MTDEPAVCSERRAGDFQNRVSSSGDVLRDSALCPASEPLSKTPTLSTTSESFLHSILSENQLLLLVPLTLETLAKWNNLSMAVTSAFFLVVY
jgi:hypothetical protein